MEDQTNNEVIEAVEKGLEKMENEGVLNGSDFTKPWRSSDVIFLVDEQRFYVHAGSSQCGLPFLKKCLLRTSQRGRKLKSHFQTKRALNSKKF